MGNNEFLKHLPQSLFKLFKFSKVEKGKFKYLGCEIEKCKNGNITLNQNEYIQNIQEVDCPTDRNNCPVKEFERKEIRRVVGELLWVSLMTRPELSFELFKSIPAYCDILTREKIPNFSVCIPCLESQALNLFDLRS